MNPRLQKSLEKQIKKPMRRQRKRGPTSPSFKATMAKEAATGLSSKTPSSRR
jgi:hypothetical protein